MQLSLWSGSTQAACTLVSFDARFSELTRHQLGRGAWIDHQSQWLTGHERLFELLVERLAWKASRRRMYERTVDVPRLTATLDELDELPPILRAMAHAFADRYETRFPSVTAALYRDGSDSVAWHRDRDLRDADEGLVVIVSLGQPRPFSIRPLGGGNSRTFRLGWGDLLVMGGSMQRTWEHAVPKVSHAEPRMSLMFRQRRFAAAPGVAVRPLERR